MTHFSTIKNQNYCLLFQPEQKIAVSKDLICCTGQQYQDNMLVGLSSGSAIYCGETKQNIHLHEFTIHTLLYLDKDTMGWTEIETDFP